MAEQNISYKEVNEFIRNALDKHGEWLVDEFVAQLERNDNIESGNLIDTLNWSLYDPGNGAAAGLQIDMPMYGRAFEIAGKKKKVSKFPVNVNRIIWGIKERQPKNHKKRTNWYNMNMYRGVGSLIAKLSAGITEDELRHIRKTMLDSVNDNVKLFWDEKI